MITIARPDKRVAPLYVHISTLFFVLVLVACAVLATVNYLQSVKLLENAADELFTRVSDSISSDIESRFAAPEGAANLLAFQRVTLAVNFDQRMDSLSFMRQTLENTESAVSVYAGYEDGDFFLLRRVRDAADRALLNAPDRTNWVVQAIDRDPDGAAKGRFVYLDDDLLVLRTDERPDYPATYDPRARGWYRQAFGVAEAVRGDPYVFFTTGEVGVTFARSAGNGNGKGVVGVDVRLDELSHMVGRHKITSRSEIALFDAYGDLVAYDKPEKVTLKGEGKDAPTRRAKLSEIGAPSVTALGEHWQKAGAGRVEYSAAGESWRGVIRELKLTSGAPLYLGLAVPYDELVAQARSNRLRSIVIAVLVVLLLLPLTILMARRVSKPLIRLMREADEVRHFHFEERAPVRSRVAEVRDLGVTMVGMRQTIKRFLDVSTAVAGEDDFERLVLRLLKETISASGAYSGVLYLGGSTGMLKPGAAEVRGQPQVITHAQPLSTDEFPALLRNAITQRAAVAGSLSGDEARRAGLADLQIVAANATTDSASEAIAVPLFNRKRQLLGAILLCMEQPAEDALVRFVDVLSGLAAVSLETQERTKALVLAQQKLDSLVQNGIQMSRQRDRQKLLREILFGGKDLCQCDQGTMYLKTPQGTLQFALRTASGELPSFEIPLMDAASGLANDKFVSVHVALTGETVLIDDVYSETRFDLSGTKRFAQETGYRTVSMLTVPMSPRDGEVIGVLQFMNALDADTGQVIPFPPVLIRIVEALAAQSAVALENQNLLQAQKALLESFIGLMAGAIDAKSPHTGGHCQRVPELTKMLAKAACDAKEGPFAAFNISENEWEALHIAGWLHDCGKVTTPEYVVDKATKLETIYDRIHEIRTRFEILKRDAEIACFKAIAAGGDAHELNAKLAEELRTLDAEFAFIATCNEGGEFMAQDKIEKLKSIGARTWQRTLNDRLGVSWEEGRRLSRTPAPDLPVTETLLADKPSHRVPRGPQDIIPEDNPWGFKLKVPEYLYNRGEVYNLSVARGTLTEEERYKINEHIVRTIIMLSQLPLPPHLKSVPELAGGHHEKMDGTGYPKRLLRNQMSVQARIMAIADIFEALTATDRPYKKGKMLSEAIKIMAHMKKDAHVDAELFDLFLTSGVYKEYARRFLLPEYIDDVDISAYLSAA